LVPLVFPNVVGVINVLTECVAARKREKWTCGWQWTFFYVFVFNPRRWSPTTANGLVLAQLFCLLQWFPTGEEFLPRKEFHEFRGGISTLELSYLFIVQHVLYFFFRLTLALSIIYVTLYLYVI